jgi:hypothetical protein
MRSACAEQEACTLATCQRQLATRRSGARTCGLGHVGGRLHPNGAEQIHGDSDAINMGKRVHSCAEAGVVDGIVVERVEGGVAWRERDGEGLSGGVAQAACEDLRDTARSSRRMREQRASQQTAASSQQSADSRQQTADSRQRQDRHAERAQRIEKPRDARRKCGWHTARRGRRWLRPVPTCLLATW